MARRMQDFYFSVCRNASIMMSDAAPAIHLDPPAAPGAGETVDEDKIAQCGQRLSAMVSLQDEGCADR